MEKENKATSGSLRISEDVLATIAVKAASGISGVSGLIGDKNQTKPGGLKLPGQKPVKIQLEDDQAVLDLYIRVKYGSNIRTVCEALQQAVKEDVQTMTGIAVSKVNVHVEDIVFEEPQA